MLFSESLKLKDVCTKSLFSNSFNTITRSYNNDGNPKMLEIEIDKFSTFTLIATETGAQGETKNNSIEKIDYNNETSQAKEATKVQTGNYGMSLYMLFIGAFLLLTFINSYYVYCKWKKQY